MRLDWEIAKRGFRRYAAYPGATVAGAFTNTVFGFMQAYVLLAVYRHRTDVGGYDAARAVTYGPAAELTARVARSARLVDLQIAEPDIEQIVRRIYAGGRAST